MENIQATSTSGEGSSRPLPLRQHRKLDDKQHFDGQKQQQLPFPIRITPPHAQGSPGPRSPTESYNEMRRWAAWEPLDRNKPKALCGNWFGYRVHPITLEDALRLVRELVAWGILPDCFLSDVEGTLRVSEFDDGPYHHLFKLRCQCSEGVSPASGGAWNHQTQRAKGPEPIDDPSRRLLPCPDLPQEVLLHLSVPIDPYFKTESEVATAHFARTQGLPVPEIYMYDSSARNCLGLEWQIVQKMTSCYNLGEFKDAVDRSLGPQQTGERIYESSQPWGDFGMRLSESVRALRSRAFDKIGSLYWDHEACDFVVGPVSSRFFVASRRLLYCGDDDVQRSHRGPFRTVGEFLESHLAIWSQEAADEALRCDIGPPEPPTDNEIDENQDEGSKDAVEDMGSRRWYLQADADRIHQQVSQLRDTILPYLTSHLPLSQTQTYISHPQLHHLNILVDRLPPDRSDRSHPADVPSTIVMPEPKLAAIADWEHTIALPDYLISPAKIQTEFFHALPHVWTPPARSIYPLRWLLGESGDGGQSLRKRLPFLPPVPPEEFPSDITCDFPPNAVDAGDMYTMCEGLCEVFAPCSTETGVAVPRTRLQLLLYHIFSNVDFYAREDCLWIDDLAEQVGYLVAAEEE